MWKREDEQFFYSTDRRVTYFSNDHIFLNIAYYVETRRWTDLDSMSDLYCDQHSKYMVEKMTKIPYLEFDTMISFW